MSGDWEKAREYVWSNKNEVDGSWICRRAYILLSGNSPHARLCLPASPGSSLPLPFPLTSSHVRLCSFVRSFSSSVFSFYRFVFKSRASGRKLREYLHGPLLVNTWWKRVFVRISGNWWWVVFMYLLILFIYFQVGGKLHGCVWRCHISEVSCFLSESKLLIYDFFPKFSFFFILHRIYLCQSSHFTSGFWSFFYIRCLNTNRRFSCLEIFIHMLLQILDVITIIVVVGFVFIFVVIVLLLLVLSLCVLLFYHYFLQLLLSLFSLLFMLLLSCYRKSHRGK